MIPIPWHIYKWLFLAAAVLSTVFVPLLIVGAEREFQPPVSFAEWIGVAPIMALVWLGLWCAKLVARRIGRELD